MKALKIESSCDNFQRFLTAYILIYIHCSCAHFFWCALLVDWMTSATSGPISIVYKEPMSMKFHQKSNRHQKWNSSSSSSLSSPQSLPSQHLNYTSKLSELENTILPISLKSHQLDNSKLTNDDDHQSFDGFIKPSEYHF